jgi:L-seryl-tRNA(Ser) seleniumtransferase
MEDLGSGSLVELHSLGIAGEPGVADSLRAGVDLVTYSGDKLLGGPQAGLLTGRSQLIARIRSNPLFRALRVDKLTYAALEGTLLAYVRRDHDSIPALRMLRLSAEEIGRRGELLKAKLEACPAAGRMKIEIVDGQSVVGGGAAPAARLTTRLLAITCEGASADEVSAGLRAFDPPVIARVEEGRVLLDLRTVLQEQEDLLAEALLALVNAEAKGFT